MLFSIIVFLVFLVKFNNDFKRTALALFPVSLLFTTLPLVVIGKTVIPLNLSLFFLFYFLCIRKKIYPRADNPFKKCLYVAIATVGLIAVGGAYRSPYAIVIGQLYLYIFPLFLYPFLQSKKSVVLFLRYLFIVLCLISVNGIIEFIFHKNLWMYFLQSQTSVPIFQDYADDIRMGYGRCNSVFYFPIPFGDICAIAFGFFLLLLYKANHLMERKKVLILMGLMFIGVILSNSRAPILAMMVACLHFPIKKQYIKPLCIFGLLVFLLMGNYLLSIVNSITDVSSSDVGGSSVHLRLSQLLISIYEFVQNPIFGGGYNRVEIAQEVYKGQGLAGAESHLFVLMINEGIVGIISYVYSYITLFLAFPKGQRKFPFILASAWVVAAFVSLTTGLTIVFPMVLLMVIYQANKLKLIKL